MELVVVGVMSQGYRFYDLQPVVSPVGDDDVVRSVENNPAAASQLSRVAAFAARC